LYAQKSVKCTPNYNLVIAITLIDRCYVMGDLTYLASFHSLDRFCAKASLPKNHHKKQNFPIYFVGVALSTKSYLLGL